VPSPQEGTFL